jgi:hypothetical protein
MPQFKNPITISSVSVSAIYNAVKKHLLVEDPLGITMPDSRKNGRSFSIVESR